MAITYNTGTVTGGLALYLDSANTKSYAGTGTTWFDLSGNGRNGSKAGSQSPTYPQWNASGFFDFTGGVTANNYSRFDVGSIPSFSAVSAFVWYRTSDTTSNKTIIRMDNSDIELSVNGSSTVYMAAGTNWNDVNFSGTVAATDNKWHYIGLTFNGTVLTGFFDSVQLGTTVRGSSTTTAAGTLRIGTRDDVYAHHFVGQISTVVLYDRVLSPSEIKQNFNATRSRYGV